MEMKNKVRQVNTMELQIGPFFMVIPISMEDNDNGN
jgi:hypothetical protein